MPINSRICCEIYNLIWILQCFLFYISQGSFHEAQTYYDRIARAKSECLDAVRRNFKDDKELEYQESIPPVVVLVGCKCDLENERRVSSEEAQAFAEKHSIPYIETSAKDRINHWLPFLEVYRGMDSHRILEILDCKSLGVVLGRASLSSDLHQIQMTNTKLFVFKSNPKTKD